LWAGAPAGPPRRQDHPTDQVRPDQGDLLGDEAADGEPEQVDPAELPGGDEGDRVVRHLLDRGRRHPGRAADPGVVERHDAPVGSQVVDQRRIPAVEVPAEVLEQDERQLALAGLAVRVVDAVRRPDKLVRQR